MEGGNYLYCIIRAAEARNFGPIGIGGRGDTVSTLNFEDISAVISMSSSSRYDLKREHLLAHQTVIEEVMKEYTVLPVRFSTIAGSAEDIRSLLRKRYKEFKNLLSAMDNRVEHGLKAAWKDMGAVFNEIVKSDAEIRRLKEKIGARKDMLSYNDRITLGKLTAAALERKKTEEAEILLCALRPITVDMRLNKVMGDNMFLNAAFLVDRSMVREFDIAIKELDEKNGRRTALKYIGPAAPFNFVNIVVEWK